MVVVDVHPTKVGKILVKVPFSQKDVVGAVPGAAWSKTRGEWTVPLSWAACVQLRAVFGDALRVGEGLCSWAWLEKLDRVDPAVALRGVKDQPMNWDGALDGTLFPFQRAGRDFLVTAGDCLLADDTGSGKSIQTLAALDKVARSKGDDHAYPALIVCPNSVKRSWAGEIKKWLPQATPIIIDGTRRQREKQLTSVAGTTRAIVVINYEALRLHSRLAGYGSTPLRRGTCCGGQAKMSQCEAHDRELNTVQYTTLVCDEAHYLKEPRSKCTRAMWRLSENTSVMHRWALTATPIANNPVDLWAIWRFLNPHELGSRSAFIDRYVDVSFNPFGGMNIKGLKQDTKTEFFQITDPRVRRMRKEDCLDQLPEKVYETRYVSLSAKQRRLYKQMEDTSAAVLDDGTPLIAPNHLTALTRLLQFTSATCVIDKHGSDNPEEWKVELEAPSSKVDELVTIIKDNPGRAMAVSAEHKKLITVAQKRLKEEKIPFVSITGGMSTQARQEALEAFQNGGVDVILFTLKAGGTGLTMTRADLLIRLQRSFSQIDNIQGEGRVLRIGSEIHDTITIIDLITPGTVEEHQLSLLAKKTEHSEEFLRDNKKDKHG